MEQLFFFRCLERIAGLKMHVDSVNKAAQKISYAAEEEYNLVLNCSGDPSNDLWPDQRVGWWHQPDQALAHQVAERFQNFWQYLLRLATRNNRSNKFFLFCEELVCDGLLDGGFRNFSGMSQQIVACEGLGFDIAQEMLSIWLGLRYPLNFVLEGRLRVELRTLEHKHAYKPLQHRVILLDSAHSKIQSENILHLCKVRVRQCGEELLDFSDLTLFFNVVPECELVACDAGPVGDAFANLIPLLGWLEEEGLVVFDGGQVEIKRSHLMQTTQVVDDCPLVHLRSVNLLLCLLSFNLQKLRPNMCFVFPKDDQIVSQKPGLFVGFDVIFRRL